VGRSIDEQIGERRLTPMLQQYVAAKREAPADSLLFFRMGDFYELFFDDARRVASLLDLTLTSRDKDASDPIPMAGVPHHAAQTYIAKLVERGHSVSICDQLEDPAFAKGIVKRAITRLVTPGTVSDLDALDSTAAHYLAAYQPGHLVLVDLLSGEVLTMACAEPQLADQLERAGARELVWLGEEAPQVAMPVRLCPWPTQLACDGPGEAALAAAIQYLETTQRKPLAHLQPAREVRLEEYLQLDQATRRNLELTTTLRGERRGSLLWHIDRTRTALGARLLRRWLMYPLRDLLSLRARQQSVDALLADAMLRSAVRDALAETRDVERILGRLCLGHAVPADLAALARSLARLPGLQSHLASLSCPLGETWRTLDCMESMEQRLRRALVDPAPRVTGQGGIFNQGYSGELDALLCICNDGHQFLRDLEQGERQRTGIAGLRVRYNRVFGYYIEVTKAHAARVPAHYVRKQTLVGAERYTVAELNQYEEEILSADHRRRAMEQALFAELVADVAAHAAMLRRVARALALADAFASLAEVAQQGRYVAPELCDHGVLDIVDGRHPIVERLAPGGERFVPNSVRLDPMRRMLLLTGPNMAGKSTLMRQVALTAVLAQIGSFVPARSARLGLCDRVFTRVGASDDLSHGQSTFLVEMAETAAILQHATPRSLAVLDEIGRGTSTYDGMAIAWAVVEDLHDRVGCLAMFATHYHELTRLAETLPALTNANIAVAVQPGGSMVFLRTLREGAAEGSFGIRVAALAGLPEAVIARADSVLCRLEPAPRVQTVTREHPAAAALRAVDPDHVTPMQALQTLADLRALV
jgi:DNA mismatch repair protein MutS